MGRPRHVTFAPPVSVEFRILGPLEARWTADVAAGRSPPASGPRHPPGPGQRGGARGAPDRRRLGRAPARRRRRTSSRATSRSCARLLGRDAIVTRGRGYACVPDGALDLHRFERLRGGGHDRAAEGRPTEAPPSSAAALGAVARARRSRTCRELPASPVAARLDELRLIALERRIEADLACGRDAEAVAELEVAGRRAPAPRAAARAADAGPVPLRTAGRGARGLPRARASARRRARASSPAPSCRTSSGRSSGRIPTLAPGASEARPRRPSDRAPHGRPGRAGAGARRSGRGLGEPLCRRPAARAGAGGDGRRARPSSAARRERCARSARRSLRARRGGAGRVRSPR